MSDISDPRNDPHGKYNGNEIVYVSQVLDSANYRTQEPFTVRFEQAFAKRFGMDFAIAHNSGTTTLLSCLAAAGVGMGDEVICPAQAVLMNAATILYQNAVPVIADIDGETLNIDPADIEKKITNRTKAIFVVHMHGLPADMDPIMAIAEKHGITVIEDTAQCVLGTYKGRLAGTMGHMASFSMESKKHLSTGEGGMVLTNDEHFGTVVRKTAFNGYRAMTAGKPLRQLLPEQFQDPDYERHDTLGLNFRMNEVTAAVGLAQLERIDQIVGRRQQVAEYFMDAISSCDWMVPQKVPDDYVNSYYTFTARYKGKQAIGASWKDFYNKYKAMGGDGFYAGLKVVYSEPMMREKVFLKSGYLPPDQGPEGDRFAYEQGMCPVAEEAQPEMMSFKTNYRDMETAKQQAGILGDLIKDLDK
ncbi:MAG: DegT/DnrJ/EryC1/StrS family aminotransferase [Rhodospirillales bacterium]|nr:DegT/DnrJ/EryC1/StrS family aminotransferase [Rhodospirillales bacterium]